MVDRPSDQGSRWSSGSNNQQQFVTIKLDKVGVLTTITFGKYHKVHVCNLKEFKVFGGLSTDNMVELLHSGLRNDSEAETFPLKYKANGVIFPVQYIKLVPLMAWGANFNFSIWYVELKGFDEAGVVDRVYRDYMNHRETESIRLILKHFRQRNLIPCFNLLQQTTQLQLEDPMLTNLHKLLVVDGNFEAAEELMESSCERGLFLEWLKECKYKPVWRRVYACDENGESPCMRGGHQMCIDSEGGRIFLFGGWDGAKDLSDFWMYDVNNGRWNLLSSDTRRQNGPGPRSCHKICYDPASHQIYSLGRYVDVESRPHTNLDSDFWRYDTISHKWYRISSNTAADGGPQLIYDHQMCMDPEGQVLYVFGGRTVSMENSAHSYSGLYAWYANSNRWRLLRSDTTNQEGTQLKSRIGHSMLYNSAERQLFIFAGQRNKDYLSDFYIYDIPSDTVSELSRDYSKLGGPEPGFTQRATIDTDLNELYVLSGLMRDKITTQETVKNSFWVYKYDKDRWIRIYQNENVDPTYWNKMKDVEPMPRFAHQLVFDCKRKVQYLFGGNPGEPGNPSLRLDDFWELHLQRPHPSDLLRQIKFEIRKQRFREMCFSSPAPSLSSSMSSNASSVPGLAAAPNNMISSNSIKALKYLQTHVIQVVNHADEEESAKFRALSSSLFVSPENQESDSTDSGMQSHQQIFFKSRTELYEKLVDYFPENMKQPKGSLIDLIKME
ncbi:Muskelin N-terminus-domain-containing protein [Paraphysoderma sedebokerense]|nr:Muskelin N-terminus-domain-containing protein [Paraphysoderma sedebokerense]